MSLHFLDFEQPIAELEAKIEELKSVNQGGEFDVSLEEEITRLREKKLRTHKQDLFRIRGLANIAIGQTPNATLHSGLYSTHIHRI